jgi:hypothetical protein
MTACFLVCMKGRKLIFRVHEVSIMLFDMSKTHGVTYAQTVRNVSHVRTTQFATFKELPFSAIKTVNSATCKTSDK